MLTINNIVSACLAVYNQPMNLPKYLQAVWGVLERENIESVVYYNTLAIFDKFSKVLKECMKEGKGVKESVEYSVRRLYIKDNETEFTVGGLARAIAYSFGERGNKKVDEEIKNISLIKSFNGEQLGWVMISLINLCVNENMLDKQEWPHGTPMWNVEGCIVSWISTENLAAARFNLKTMHADISSGNPDGTTNSLFGGNFRGSAPPGKGPSILRIVG